MGTDAAGVEWVGGAVLFPQYVLGDDGPARPSAIMWLIPDGPIIGNTVVESVADDAAVVADFLERCRRPMYGAPQRPARVRVASPELAARLREAVGPATEVLCAPTPELDEAMRSFKEYLSKQSKSGAPPSYLALDVDAPAMRGFFTAAAELHRAAPWGVVEGDTAIAVTSKRLGLERAAVSIIGQMGESYGYLLFASEHDFDAYVDDAARLQDGECAKLPPHLVLNYERGAKLHPACRKEIVKHGWEVASAEAHPWPVMVDEDVVARPTTRAELTQLEAIALGLAKLTADDEALDAVFGGPPSDGQAIAVETSAGIVDLFFEEALLRERDDDWFAIDMVISSEYGDIDEDLARDYADELMCRFANSEEASALPDVGWAKVFIDGAVTCAGANAAQYTSSVVRDVVFDFIPEKVTVAPSTAPVIVAQLRAFFAFLGREFALPEAKSCARVLAGAAAEKLEAALGDPRRYGPAKAMMMQGLKEGYDVHTEKGWLGWMHELNARIASSPAPRATRTAPKRADANRKAERKAQRRARQRNR